MLWMSNPYMIYLKPIHDIHDLGWDGVTDLREIVVQSPVDAHVYHFGNLRRYANSTTFRFEMPDTTYST